MIVEGQSADKIQNWLNITTPEEAYLLAYNNGGKPTTSYEEEIMYSVDQNSKVDYVINEDE
jgi:hypothetical protein